MALQRTRTSILALALLVGTSAPASATEPEPAAPPMAPTDSPSVHAEMLAEHAGDAAVFEPGAAPAPMTAAPAVQGEGGAGGIAGLPNGLRREVFGYLPYWAVSGPNLGHLNYGLVSSIAYFSVGARADGSLAKTSGGEPTVGWAGWNSSAMTTVISKAHERGVKVVLTVTMMAWDYDFSSFATLLKSSTNRGRLAAEIAAAVKSRNADGVNLDFEPMPNSLESYYTLLVRKVKAELVAAGAGSYLTVATTGGAASWDEGYELVDNADANTYSLVSPGGADAVMAMAYDFNWSGSSRAGGVAPMDSPYVLDARTAMNDYLSLLPPSKIIWGVPYYGRAWTTSVSSLNGRTCTSAGSCTPASWASGYAAAREAAQTYGRKWDDVGDVSWYTYVSSTYDTHVQGYYDDSASLNVKYDFVKANDVRGVGIWHLLMDAPRTELWDRIAVEFRDLPFADIADSAFVSEIIWLADAGITTGCTATLFCPRDPVSRSQMATFLARALALPPSSTDWFTDDDGLSHEDSINRLADAGITTGCTDTEFCPRDPVTRGQMASFLARALALPASTTDWFTDDDGTAHEDSINRLADAGITTGCAATRFCPSGTVIRQQMAAFLFRALGS
jgi:spore germination protein YaaH